MAFGGTGFGSTGPTPAPNFGTFGTSTPATKATGFGTPGFSFGAASSTTATATNTGFGFGGFGTGAGATTTTSSAGPSFGLGSFSSQQATPSLFSGFGTQTTQPSTGVFTGFGGFGTKPGGTAAATTATPFGTFGGFSSTPTFSTATTFSTAPTFSSGIGQPQTYATLSCTQPENHEALYNAVFNCNVYGDERDSTLARWNLLQALWGTGKGYYSPNHPPVEFTLHNPLCRFKAIGYSCIPSTDNREGLVALTFSKKDEELKSQHQQLTVGLGTVLGSKPNLTVYIDIVRPISETRSQVIIYVIEKGATGVVRRIPAIDLANYFLQPLQKQQLTQMGVENVYPQVMPDKEQVEEYLSTAPAGIDPRIWKQARLDNPNPEKYIPVPMVGFGEVRWRLKCQEQETRLHQLFLEHLGGEIAALQRRHSTTLATMAEHRRRFIDLEHRVLRVLVKQECSRRLGLALQPEEEALRGRLEALQVQMNTPTHFKARLKELLSQMRTHSMQLPNKGSERYVMDPGTQEDIRQFLLMEQNGMSHLVNIIQSDLAALKLMKEGLMELLQNN